MPQAKTPPNAVKATPPKKSPAAAPGDQEGAPVGTGTPVTKPRMPPSSGQAGSKKG
jgi:hypothetical protein